MTTRAEHLATLEELHAAVFGRQPGDEPNVYALDYDDLTALSRRSRDAIEYFAAPENSELMRQTLRDDLNKKSYKRPLSQLFR